MASPITLGAHDPGGHRAVIVARVDDGADQVRIEHDFGPEKQAPLLLDLLVGQLLATGLNGKIGLPKRDDFFGWIGILDDEVAGVTRHHHDLHGALGTAANSDHFGDFNEMVVYPLAAVETGGAPLLDDGLEVPVVSVAQHVGKIPAYDGPRNVLCTPALMSGDVRIQPMRVLLNGNWPRAWDDASAVYALASCLAGRIWRSVFASGLLIA